MNSKTIICSAATLASALIMASDTPEVANVTMTQASFGRKVTITYELNNAPNGAVVTLDVETNATGNVWASIGGEAVCNAQGAVWRKVTSADADGNGKYTITWRPDQSWEGHKVDLASGGARARVTAWALDNTPDYMVVDISASAGVHPQKYYPSADFLPGGILGNPAYRTSAIVMRKIMAKDVTWTMGSTTLETQRSTVALREDAHQVTLTNNYYIGVFEVTQAQWALIKTDNAAPSVFSNATDRAMRPVEHVSHNDIRNSGNTAYDWPRDPISTSFLGMLRNKTGNNIDFDLPTEAQWEFAARAGNGDTKWGDGSGIQNTNTDVNLGLLGRYKMNGGYVNGSTAPVASCGADNGTAVVGTYAPNAWGLYDMHGNVTEWCQDWWVNDITTSNGAISVGVAGGARVIRGGNWSETAGNCRPAFRSAWVPTQSLNLGGFRLACTAGLK